LLMNLSLFTGRAFFLPLPVLGTCSISNRCQWTQQHKRWKQFRGWGIVLPYLSPHLPNILENHVAVPIKCPHMAK
jgi:hypothetical protein